MTTRDIKIKVTGVQSVAGADDEPEVLELETRGTYSEKNGNRYIKYDEFIEDVEEPVKNLLRFDEHALQLTKRLCYLTGRRTARCIMQLRLDRSV